MEDLLIPQSVVVRLGDPKSNLDAHWQRLYDRAKRGQWNAATAVDWSIDVPFGAPLPARADYGEFLTSPLAPLGRAGWDTFRWEFQCWIISQFLHGEQGALLASAQLVAVLADHGAKAVAATQVVDEARHIEVFSRYLAEKMPRTYPPSPSLLLLLDEVLRERRWDFTAIGMQVLVESLALAAFRMGEATFHDKLSVAIASRVMVDEARHVSFGTFALRDVHERSTAAERAEREEFVLECSQLIMRRFLLDEVWEVIGVRPEHGTEFARTSPMMVRYRQLLFGKVVRGLMAIGLMTPGVRDGLDAMGLLGYSGHRQVRRISEDMRSPSAPTPR